MKGWASMRIIIAPAKKMVVDTDSFAVDGLPQFLERTERLKTVLQGMSPKDLQALWKCNNAIAKLNVERLEQMDLRRNLTPAILSYEGIQYRYMAPGVMETAPGLPLGASAHSLRLLWPAAALRRRDSLPAGNAGKAGGGRLPGPVSVLGQPPGQAAGLGDGRGAESGLQGVQQSGGGLFAQNRPICHLCLWRVERWQGHRKGYQMQNGPWADGTLAGGEPNQKPGGYPGL